MPRMWMTILIVPCVAGLVLCTGAIAQEQKPSTTPSAPQSAPIQSCGEGRISCEAWCDKYREGDKHGCKHTNRGSCMDRFKTLTFCVRDRPPDG